MIQEVALDIAHRLGIAGSLVLASCAQCIVASSEASGDFEEFLLHTEHHHRSIGSRLEFEMNQRASVSYLRSVGHRKSVRPRAMR